MKKWLSLVLVVTLLLSLTPALRAQETEEEIARRLLERMPPEVRVGQLFMVTFNGTDTDATSIIHDLIVNEHVGGVLLRPENGNIPQGPDTPAQVAALTNQLQSLAWDASQAPVAGVTNESTTTIPYVPLFIAVEQEHSTSPYTPILSGTTPLPSPMALGATWEPSYAEEVGTVVGQELQLMGINMLLGPSLDVLNTPRPGSAADLGIRSFGGDPYWVGRMGSAYVRGVHVGSEGHIAVIPGHFPGLGAADRPLSEEVSTVQKSLEQLKQIELAPFFAVAGASDPVAQPNGLLVSHIRYRGFQGNIYASTKPVSFDPQALQQLMGLPGLQTWREERNGILVADDLGVRAVRRFYDPTEQDFRHLIISKEAFVAGNDLLILSDFALDEGDWEAQAANIRATLATFREQYATDPTWQAWVDRAVLRILRLKLDLYDASSATFLPSWAQVSEEAAGRLVGDNQESLVPISRSAVTLLSPPSPGDRPPTPTSDDWIIVFTDDRQIAACDTCPPEYVLPPTMVEETLVRLYGPQTTNQVHQGRVSSFTFSQLIDYLDSVAEPPPSEGTPPAPHPLQVALQQADWVIFAMLDINDRSPSSHAVRRFLAEQANLQRGKHVVAFAFGAPYYLDTTEITKLSVYLGLYSPTPPFVDAAVRAMFDELPFNGASPVSVSGINYDLTSQTQPDPAQTIPVFYEVVAGEQSSEPPEIVTPEGTPQPIEVHKGDTLVLQTGTIVDRNGHPVPDGTPVEFIFTYPQESGQEHSTTVTTQQGIARTTITLERIGQLQVSVRAEPVPRSVRLEMDIREGEAAVIRTPVPPPSPSPEPTPTPTPVPTPEQTATAVPDVKPQEESVRPPPPSPWTNLILGLITTTLITLVGYVVTWRKEHDPVTGVRGGLWCATGALLAYIGLTLKLPVLMWLHTYSREWTAMVVSLAGGGLALLALLAADTARPGMIRSRK